MANVNLKFKGTKKVDLRWMSDGDELRIPGLIPDQILSVPASQRSYLMAMGKFEDVSALLSPDRTIIIKTSQTRGVVGADGTLDSSDVSDFDAAVVGAGHAHGNKTQLDLVTDGDHDALLTGNPHSVTKADVGLSNVANVDQQNAANITSGTLSGDRLPALSATKLGGVPATGTPANKLLKDDGTWVAITKSAAGFSIDNAGTELPTGVIGDIIIPFACTITGVTLLADQSGSVVVDIWKDTYANAAPTVADTITAAAIPTITTAEKSQDLTITGWTTAVAEGDVLRFNINSVTTITRLTIHLHLTPTI